MLFVIVFVIGVSFNAEAQFRQHKWGDKIDVVNKKEGKCTKERGEGQCLLRCVVNAFGGKANILMAFDGSCTNGKLSSGMYQVIGAKHSFEEGTGRVVYDALVEKYGNPSNFTPSQYSPYPPASLNVIWATDSGIVGLSFQSYGVLSVFYASLETIKKAQEDSEKEKAKAKDIL